jgi:hypothetical protein
MIGEKFGRLTVVADAKHGYWHCRCECGKETAPNATHLRSGRVKSCGCWREARKITHGMSRTPTYDSWRAMIKRCDDPKSDQYANYGGRGIKVCERWRKFENFYSDMGEKPEGKSLDRHPDYNGNYEPGNCRWATQTQQIRNKRNTTRVTYEGEELPLAELCERKGMKLRKVRHRLALGMSIERALQPIRHNRWDNK